MQHLLRAVRQALADGNHYAALTQAIILPDICASLEASDGKTCRKRYAAWWDTFIGPLYRRPIGPAGVVHVFMTGGDCYALRCAFLHQGLDDITEHDARVALERFQFVEPSPDFVIHCNQTGATLQLQVDVFCEEMCQAVEKWSVSVAADPDVAARMGRLMRIQTLRNG